MTSLHQITFGIKFLFKWMAIISASIIVFILLFKLGGSIKEFFYPTPPTPATLSFGKLPKIIFPQGISDNNTSYSLNTLTGALPVFPNKVSVFKTEKPAPNLLSLERTKVIVSKIGFKSLEKRINQTKYEWIENDPYLRKIDYDVLSYDFSYTTDFYSDSYVLSGENMQGENNAIEKSQSFLNNLSSFPSDIDTSKTKTALFNIQESSLNPATSLSSTKIIRVDFYQNSIDMLPIFYNHPDFSNIYALVGGGRSDTQVVEANFLYDNISSSSATYYIKTSDQAFSELKSHKAYIPKFMGVKNNVSITDIFLAYYMSDEHQDYLMPIIVFEGSNNFTAYVSAIKEDLLE